MLTYVVGREARLLPREIGVLGIGLRMNAEIFARLRRNGLRAMAGLTPSPEAILQARFQLTPEPASLGYLGGAWHRHRAATCARLYHLRKGALSYGFGLYLAQTDETVSASSVQREAPSARPSLEA